MLQCLPCRSVHILAGAVFILLMGSSSSLVMQGMPQEQLALPLMVMLAQQRRFIAVQTATGPLKLIAELYDKAQESLYLVRRHDSLQLSYGRRFDTANINCLWQRTSPVYSFTTACASA